MSATHVLSDTFKTALLSGVLNPVLAAVQTDDTLMMGFRGSYISLYYRGGEILAIDDSSTGRYKVSFNKKYDTELTLRSRLARHGSAEVLDHPIVTAEDAAAVVAVFGELKGLMDSHSKIRSGHEREFQQLMARVNNRTRSSNSSHYFITDIEHKKDDARFDMLGVRWRHDEHKHGDRLVPVLFEMKYGADAMDGKSGLEDHLRKALAYVSDDAKRAVLRANVASQFNQLSELGLLEYARSTSISGFSAVDNHVQIVFVLAEYPPHATRLTQIVDKLDDLMADYQVKFESLGLTVDLRFAGASLSGYAMHEATMLTTAQLRALLAVWHG